MNEEAKGMLAAAAAYSIFGLSYLFSKLALNVTEPAILLCARFTLTLIILNILVLSRFVKIDLKKKKKHLWQAVLLGFLQPVGYFILENYGLKYTTTSFTGMISSVTPVFTAILGVLLLHERPAAKQWLFIVLSIIGVAMISLQTANGGANTPAGCICLVAAYFLGSFYTLLVRRLSKEYTPFELTYVMFTVGFVFFVFYAFAQFGGNTPAVLADACSHGQFLIAVVYLGGLSSVGAYLLVNYSLARLPVARATIFNTFSTVVGVLAGVVILHDPFTWYSLAAFVLMLGSVLGYNLSANKAE